MAIPDFCAEITTQFFQETGRLAPTLFQTLMADGMVSPWVAQIPKEEWPDRMGYTITTQIRERTISPVRTPWSEITGADSCSPPEDTIPVAWTNTTATRLQKAINSDWICINDLRSSTFPDQFVEQEWTNLVENVNREWMLQTRDWYFDSCAKKVINIPGFPYDADDFPAVQPTSTLTKGVLDHFMLNLGMDGFFRSGTVGRDSLGQQIIPVIAGKSAIDGIIKLNEDIRQDVRWSSQVDRLLGPIGIKQSYGNYVFIPEDMPMRFNWNGSGFTRVPEYVQDATTFGNSAEVNPAYLNAEYEAAWMLHPDVIHVMVPTPNFSAGRVKFGPQDYMGDFTFINEFDLQCNVDRNKGFFRATLSAAPRPIQTRYGVAILSLRCYPSAAPIACPQGSGYYS